MSNRIWIVETKNYRGKEIKPFHSEASFKNYINKGGRGNVRIYDLSSEITTSEYRENIKESAKSELRELRFKKILDGDYSKELKESDNISKLCDIISLYLKSGKTKDIHRRANLSRLLQSTNDTEYFIKLLKRYKRTVIYHVLSSVEEFEILLNIFNFRSFPKGINSKSVNDTIDYYPNQYRMFNEAKEKQQQTN